MADADSETDDRQRLRLRIFGLIAISLFASLFARLWFLQVMQREDLRAEASANILRVVHEEAPRGRIFDREGRLLVDNKVVHVVMIDRRELNNALDGDDQEEMFLQLALIVSRSGRLTKVLDIDDRLEDPEFGPFDDVPVAIDVDPDLLVYLGERSDLFPGISVQQRTVRTYPYGQLGAHVLGYVGPLTTAELEEQNARIRDHDALDSRTYQPSDEIGKTGVERIFEDELRGIPGRRFLEVNAANEIVEELEDRGREPVPGNDVYLTIDIDVQQLVEEQLRAGLEVARNQTKAEEFDPDFVASAGAAVALDPRDGSLIAMASFPTYDPRDFIGGISQRLFDGLTSEENFSPILNRAIQGEYAPGSTFKPVTTYAALTQGVLGPEGTLGTPDSFYNDVGWYRYPICEAGEQTCVFRSPYCCGRGVDLRDAITVSSDTYFYRIGGEGFFQRQAPADEGIQESARLFGLGAGSGIALPYERGGVVPDRDYFDLQFDRGVFLRNGDQWFAGDTIQLAIGQGDLLVTPLQLASVYATIASDGVVHQPNIAIRISNRDGDVLQEFGPRVLRVLPWPDEVRDPLLDGLNGVTAYNIPGGEDEQDLIRGTAFEAFNLPGAGGVNFPLELWPVAGKTGTAQKIGQVDNALFAGFGPASWPEQGIENEPEIVVAVILEESGFGGDVAAPLVARILRPIAEDRVERARTAEEIDLCHAEVAVLAAFMQGVRIGEIKVDSAGNPLSVERPPISDECLELVGGQEAIEEFGVEALDLS